jgi:hypothetical protein
VDIRPTLAERKTNWTLLGVVACVLLLGAGGLYLVTGRSARPRPVAALSPEAKAYTRFLRLSDVDMKGAENFMRVMVVEITGRITNQGDKVLKLVEINCVFYDPYNQVIARERVPIVRSRGGLPLQPGESREFRLPFDTLPPSWNQAVPQLVIANIEFEP